MGQRPPATPLTLGIDFGTSNSAVAAMPADGEVRLLALEGDASTLPTAVFFNAEDRSIHFGREAIGLYLQQVDGRLMRSLKSLLGSSLLQEQTAVPEGMVSFQDIISRFLKELRQRAEAQLGRPARRAVIGRPVHFVDDAPGRDQQAQAALQQAATAAGFDEVSFQLEPIAAAFDYERRVTHESRVLIVDIGGGTSDFTVVRLGPQRRSLADRSQDILATTGVHIGGTDYDHRLSLGQVMPLLGLHHIGPAGREVPARVFLDLSTWHMINWLYTPQRLREAQQLRTNYADARLHERLLAVLQRRLGHRLASLVEQAKIDGSNTQATAYIDLAAVEMGLQASLSPDDLARALDPLFERVVQCAHDCVSRAGLQPSQLDALYLTGGSSALPAFQQALRRAFPGVALVEGDLFGGVASGLALSRTPG
ncbi:MAG: Hsp70 family protein [Burkholderiales bacterium]|jgi:hypothetical chaperone protein|nr:Hsp70 family protein [Burkholderiales bacterium]